MSEAKKRSRPWIIWALLIVFVIYPLSIGPACWISGKAGVSLGWTNYFYAPVMATVRKSHTASKILMWYLDLFPD